MLWYGNGLNSFGGKAHADIVFGALLAATKEDGVAVGGSPEVRGEHESVLQFLLLGKGGV